MDSARKRIVVTGMGINTPLGDTLDSYYDGLMAGKSAIRHWTCVETDGIYSKVGGDLSHYDHTDKLAAHKEALPLDAFKRLRKLVKKAPFSTKLSMLCAVDAFVDADLAGKFDPARAALCIGGHNLNKNYHHKNLEQFREEPDYVDSLASLLSLDTDHAGSVGEVLGLNGPIYTVGGACASGNIALRMAIDEIRHHDHDVAIVVGAALEYTQLDLHAMALMGAISFQGFNDEPTRASRPYDSKREGFVPSHGTGVLIIESLDHAQARGAKVYAEVLHASAMSDGSHLPSPSVGGQTRTMARLLKQADVKPDESASLTKTRPPP